MTKILIVDDHENTRFTLSMILKKEGFKLSEADSGPSAIQLINQENFDIVITDLKMDKVDGFEILKCILKANFCG